MPKMLSSGMLYFFRYW